MPGEGFWLEAGVGLRGWPLTRSEHFPYNLPCHHHLEEASLLGYRLASVSLPTGAAILLPQLTPRSSFDP
jgi:hypothetical protein